MLIRRSQVVAILQKFKRFDRHLGHFLMYLSKVFYEKIPFYLRREMPIHAW